MALINCPDCKRQVSDQAQACPNCGHPIGGKSTSVGLRSCPDCVQGEIRKTCSYCDGCGRESCGCDRGFAGYGDGTPCQDCHGSQYLGPCGSCAGRGYNWEKCKTCLGSGQLTIANFDVLIKNRQEATKKQEEANRQAELKRQQEEAKRQAEIKKAQEEQARRKLLEEQKAKEEHEHKAQALLKFYNVNLGFINTVKERERKDVCQICERKPGLFGKIIPLSASGVKFHSFVHDKCDPQKEFRVKLPIIIDDFVKARAWLSSHGYIDKVE